MLTRRMSQRFVDPNSWMTGQALKSALAVISHIERGAFLANDKPVAFTLWAYRGDRYEVTAAARELRSGQAMAGNSESSRTKRNSDRVKKARQNKDLEQLNGPIGSEIAL